ncbi:MAG TPA: type I methionyl aminopeptidase [Candidatus Andersenbacteria bacterium]|nr:type I methionyl aminopeptidase [Candidatus Andersenbacteria bacterium]
MIRLKSAQEIERLAVGGGKLATILDELVLAAQVGVTPRELDALARERIAAHGAVPAFLNYAPDGRNPFPAALCVSVNDTVVHGLPDDMPLREGDVVGLDLGIVYDGLYLDSARTVGVGAVSDEAAHLMRVTRQALQLGINQARVGNTTGDIGAAVQQYVENEGLNVVTALVGHGVGFAVHEEPKVPNYGEPGEGEELVEGLVIAIEPMVTIGKATVKTGPDGWGIMTKTGKLSAHEEHTVAITAAGPRVLTTSTPGV